MDRNTRVHYKLDPNGELPPGHTEILYDEKSENRGSIKVLYFILSAILQFCCPVIIGWQTNWIVGVCVFLVIFGHNIEKH